MGWQDAPIVSGASAASAPAASPALPAWASAPVVSEASPGILDRVKALPGQIAEAFTGSQRRTAETEALPDWVKMPELSGMGVRAEGASALAPLQAAIGSQLAGPEELAKIIQANFPGVQTRQDEKGNFFFKSSMNGQEYAVKPGFRASDIGRALFGAATFTPAGAARTLPGLAVASAGTQTLIEGSQAATGGEFNPGEVVAAAALAPVVPAVVSGVRAATQPVKQLAARVRGTPTPTAAALEATSAIPATAGARESLSAVPLDAATGAQAATPNGGQSMVWRNADTDVPVTFKKVEPQVGPDGRMYARVEVNGRESFVPADELVAASSPPKSAPAVAPMAATDLAQTAKKAAEGGLGSKSATESLAAQAAPDAKVLESAKRLGIEEYLQPDHVTTNQAYRELAQAVKSIPGSEARAAELQGLAKVGERADKLISDIGGITDLSTLDSGVKRNLQAVQVELQGRGDYLYAKVRETIPARTQAPATNVLEFIEQRAKDLDGKENLTLMEKRILARLSPKPMTSTETVPGNALMPGSMRDSTRQVTTQRQPTYTLLDDVRKDVGAAARARGPFKDADTGLAKKLYGLITKDQEAVVGAHGLGETYNAAKSAVQARKGIEDDLVALFGKQLDDSMVRDLSGAVRALPQGDASRFIKLLQVVPPEMRQEVTASGLATAFRTAGTRGPISFSQFEKWYEGLLRNKQSHAALMSNLPPQARRQITDLYRVSRGISAASRERITTGRIMAVQDQFKAADTLAGKLYEAAKRSAVGAAVGTAATPILGPGVGAALASVLVKGARPAADKAVDALIASPEFIRLARAGTGAEQAAAARKFANGPNFKRFMQSIGSPRELSDSERWVMQALQASQAGRED